MTWTGQWVADRLDVRLDPVGETGVSLTDLVGLAVRRNPRRAHLLVSTVLGKHVPTDPRVVYGAGRLLGDLVAATLTGTEPDLAGARRLAGVLRGELPVQELPRLQQPAVAVPAVVLGYAETATGLGHAVADALRAEYLHSTRRPDGGPAGGFAEEHSHATDHLLLPENPLFLRDDRPLVLVDDELSTGRTALNTLRAMPNPRRRVVIATLVDLRTAADRQAMAAVAAELGIRLDVVSLAAGEITLPPDVLERGARLVASQPADGTRAAQPRADLPVELRWPVGTKEGGRHGFGPADQSALGSAAACGAAELALRIPPGARVLVLGTEELMYAPLRTALELVDLVDGQVLFSTTTRSPVLAVDDPAYAIRSRLTFAALDDPADGPGERYAYNVAGGGFTDIVLVTDGESDTARLRAPDGLLSQLRAAADRVQLLVVPSYHRPVATSPDELPEPLRGPAFGSYAAAEVAWLLTDLSAVELEAPIEEREEAIQAGAAHYAESLPIEYQPGEQYQELFRQALTASAARVAVAVGVVTELTLAARGPGAVLVSLARAGTPIGILMRRWAQRFHGLEPVHYAVSIVRDRGIDTVALRYLAKHHDPAAVMFVDGWTGKGAITRELAAAVRQANTALGTMFAPDLAVLADTGGCVSIYGTRQDYLVPSACLNSTVSGLVSRTVLNETLLGPGDFHGAKFYAELAGADVSAVFLDAVTAEFTGAHDEAVAAARAPVDRTPTWAGWQTVQRLCDQYGISNPNLVKPGVGETTRVLLRRVPWKVLMRTDAAAELGHLELLAAARGVPVELVDDLSYSCVGLIHPEYARPGA